MSSHDPLLKTQRMAEALGVSPSTIKRWVDSGELRGAKTVGNHRLVTVSEAIRFARSRGLSVEKLAGLAVGGGTASTVGVADPQSVEALVSTLRRGRAAEARARIVAAHAELGSGWKLADEFIRPALEAMGHEWTLGALDVYQEHRASRIIESAVIGLITAVSARPLPADAPVALGATPEGDHYTIPNLLAELTLRELGWDVVNLGPNLPLSSLARATQAQRPALIWLSIHHLAEPERFVREYSQFHQQVEASGAAICLGGPGLTPRLRSGLRAASLGERFAHLAEFARRLRPLAERARQSQLDDPNGPESEEARP